MHPKSRHPSKLQNSSRRQFIKTSAAVGAVAFAAPWVTTKARAAGELTVILNQGLLAKLWIDHLNPVFEKQTGAKLNVQQSVTANMLAMLKTQKDNPPDLMQFSEAGVFLAAKEGLLRAHNPKNIPNFAMLRDEFKLADNFSAGVVDAMHTIYFNTNQQKQAPTAWADLWDPKNKGRAAFPPITWNSGVRMVTSAAQIATGKPFKEAQYELEAGIRHLAKLKENGAVVYTGAPQAIQMLQSGQVPLVGFYGIFINPIIDGGAPIAPATNLKEGKHGEVVGMNMPAKAKNVELAEVYTNLSIGKDLQSKIDSVLRARAGHKEVNPSARTIELLGPPENITYADWKFLSEQRPKLTDMWNNVFG
ncbi:MAG: extracellular solute-binding protein [Alphaproteobacteria bacterium]